MHGSIGDLAGKTNRGTILLVTRSELLILWFFLPGYLRKDTGRKKKSKQEHETTFESHL